MSAESDRRKDARLIAFVGIAHALLFFVSYGLLTSSPGPSASDAELQAFYGSENRYRLIVVGLYVMPFAGIAFLWFAVALRAWMRPAGQRSTEILSGVQLASGILYVGLFFAAAASSSVMAISGTHSEAPVDPMLQRQFPQYSATLLLVFVMRVAATFVLTTSQIGRMTGELPRWFANSGWIVGIALLLSGPFSRVLALVLPLWQLALCLVILARASRPHDELRGIDADPDGVPGSS